MRKGSEVNDYRARNSIIVSIKVGKEVHEFNSLSLSLTALLNEAESCLILTEGSSGSYMKKLIELRTNTYAILGFTSARRDRGIS